MKQIINIPIGYAATFTTDALTSGTYTYIEPLGGAGHAPIAVAVSTTYTIGPFNEARNYELVISGNIPHVTQAFSGTFSSDDEGDYATVAYVDEVQAGLIADGVTAWQSGVESDISGLQADDANTVHKDDVDVSANGWVLDEDDMSSNSAAKVPTQQSVKAYVDANAGGGGAPTASPTFTGDVTLASTDLGMDGIYSTPLIVKLNDNSGKIGISRNVNDGGDFFYSDLASYYYTADSVAGFSGAQPKVIVSAEGITCSNAPLTLDFLFADAPTVPQFAVTDGSGTPGQTSFMIDTYNGTCWLNNNTGFAISSQSSDTNVYPDSDFVEVQINPSGITLNRNASQLMYAYSTPADVPTSTLVYELNGTGITMQGGGKIIFDKAASAETSNAVTINAQAGVITTSSLSTASGDSYLVTLTNSKIVGTGSVIIASVAGGTNTTKNFSIESKCTAASTATITIYNNTAETALDGTIIINFMVV